MYKLKIVSHLRRDTYHFDDLQEVALFISKYFNADSLADLLACQREAQTRIYLTYKNK